MTTGSQATAHHIITNLATIGADTTEVTTATTIIAGAGAITPMTIHMTTAAAARTTTAGITEAQPTARATDRERAERAPVVARGPISK